MCTRCQGELMITFEKCPKSPFYLHRVAHYYRATHVCVDLKGIPSDGNIHQKGIMKTRPLKKKMASKMTMPPFCLPGKVKAIL